MIKSSKGLILSLVVVVFVSCNTQNPPANLVAESTQTITEITQTPPPTPQPDASLTPAPSPSPTDSISDDELLISEDLPTWMADENIGKFIIQFGDIIDFYKYLGVINAETGEIYNPKVDHIESSFHQCSFVNV